MTFYHATPAYNRRSVELVGISPDYSHTRAKVVWLAGPGRSWWAAAHCRKRHRVSLDTAVIVYRVQISPDELHKAGRGIWWSYQPISPERLAVAVQYGPGNIIIV